MSCKKLCRIALMSSALMVFQVGLSGLPNIEVVSICLLVYTIVFGWEAIAVAELFGVLEILVWGFGLWNIMYFYIWCVLVLVTMLFRSSIQKHWWLSVVINGLFGLTFGALCTIPYLAGGLHSAFVWWLNGLSYDVVHFVGYLVTALILYLPLYKVFTYCKNHV